MLPAVRALGFDTVVLGPDTLSGVIRPLVSVDRRAEEAVLRDRFVARYGLMRAATLLSWFERWRPGLVVCDEVDVGAVVAAEACAVPCVTVRVIAAGRLTRPAVVGDAWNELRLAVGLPPDPARRALGGTLSVAPAPPSLRDPSVGWPVSLHATRPAILSEDVASDEPVEVYATLGTVFGAEAGDLPRRLLEALGRLGRRALLTTGQSLDLDALAPIPDGVEVAPFVPQRVALAGCRAVVCHGGSGTVVAAVSLGIPVVVLPLGADQADNADRIVALGAGHALDAVMATADDIAEHVADACTGEAVRSGAARLAEEARALPLLEELAPLHALLPNVRTTGVPAVRTAGSGR